MCLSRYTFPLLFSDFIIPFFLKHYVVPTKKQLCFCILDTSKDSNSFIFTSQRFNLLLIFDILRWHSEFEMICFPSASAEDKLNNREECCGWRRFFPNHLIQNQVSLILKQRCSPGKRAPATPFLV